MTNEVTTYTGRQIHNMLAALDRVELTQAVRQLVYKQARESGVTLNDERVRTLIRAQTGVTEEDETLYAEVEEQRAMRNQLDSYVSKVKDAVLTSVVDSQRTLMANQQPIHLHIDMPVAMELNQQVRPTINVPEQKPSKKVVTRSEDKWGEPVVTIESVPADT